MANEAQREAEFSARGFEEEIEELMSTSGEGRVFEAGELNRISMLLERLGKPKWSSRPRIYAVLHLTDQVDLMSEFIVEGIKDISLPFSRDRLPDALTDHQRDRFYETQHLVLTRAANVEKGDGSHQYRASCGKTLAQYVANIT